MYLEPGTGRTSIAIPTVVGVFIVIRATFLSSHQSLSKELYRVKDTNCMKYKYEHEHEEFLFIHLKLNLLTTNGLSESLTTTGALNRQG